MTHDDDMREIEAALDEFQDNAQDAVRSGCSTSQSESRRRLLALIRAKLGNAAQNAATCAQGGAEVAQNDDEWLQAPLTEREKASTELAAKVAEWNTVEHGRPVDAEHEAKVEAWLDRAHFVNGNYLVSGADIDEALRLMRARPASEMKRPDDLGTMHDAAGLSARCSELAKRLVAATERDTAAGDLLRAAESIGYLTGSPGYCGDHEVITLMMDSESAKAWNKAMQSYLRQKAAERAVVTP